MSFIRLIGASLTVVAGLAMTGCETTSMSAKSGPDAVVANSKKGGTCAHITNQRSACDDQVGCYWDSESGQCASH